MADRKLENVNKFGYLGTFVAKDVYCIKARSLIDFVKQVNIDFYFDKQFMLGDEKETDKYYNWRIAVNGPETWTLRKVNRKHLGQL